MREGAVIDQRRYMSGPMQDFAPQEYSHVEEISTVDTSMMERVSIDMCVIDTNTDLVYVSRPNTDEVCHVIDDVFINPDTEEVYIPRPIITVKGEVVEKIYQNTGVVGPPRTGGATTDGPPRIGGATPDGSYIDTDGNAQKVATNTSATEEKSEHKYLWYIVAIVVVVVIVKYLKK